MQITTKRKWQIALVALFALFVITNPTVKDLKDYRGESSFYGIKRTSNLFIFSTYQFGGEKYIGVAGNFFDINHTPKSTERQSSYHDSGKSWEEYQTEEKKRRENSDTPFTEFGGHEIKP